MTKEESNKANEEFIKEQGWKFKDYNPEKPPFAQKPALQFDEEEELYYAIVFDAEVDPIKIKFLDDNNYEIETEGRSYIMIDSNFIDLIEELMVEAQGLYK